MHTKMDDRIGSKYKAAAESHGYDVDSDDSIYKLKDEEWDIIAFPLFTEEEKYRICSTYGKEYNKLKSLVDEEIEAVLCK